MNVIPGDVALHLVEVDTGRVFQRSRVLFLDLDVHLGRDFLDNDRAELHVLVDTHHPGVHLSPRHVDHYVLHLALPCQHVFCRYLAKINCEKLGIFPRLWYDKCWALNPEFNVRIFFLGHEGSGIISRQPDQRRHDTSDNAVKSQRREENLLKVSHEFKELFFIYGLRYLEYSDNPMKN